MTRLIVLVLLVVGGCGGGGGGAASSDASVDGSSGPICGQAICNEALCGTVTDSCGESIDCGMCRYRAEVVTSQGSGAELAWSNGLRAAYRSTGSVILASRASDGTWTEAPVAELVGGNGLSLTIHDEQPWLAWISDEDGVSVAVPQSANSWSVEAVDATSDNAYYVELATDSDLAAVIYTGSSEVSVAERRSGTWTTPFSQALAGTQSSTVAIAIVGGAVHAFWFDRTEKVLRMAVGVGGSYTVHDLYGPATVAGSPESLQAEVIDGRLWLLLGVDNQLFVGEVVGTQWNGESVDGTIIASINADGENALAMRDGDSPSAAYFRRTGLFVGHKEGAAWSVSPLTSTCDNGFVGAAVDDQGELHVALNDCGQFQSTVGVLSAVGAYPADYRERCNQAAERICMAAQSCGDGCVHTSDGNSNLCVDLGCAADVAGKLCGEATQDPQWLYDCDEATATPVCAVAPGETTEGIVLPEACNAAWKYELFQ